MNDFNSDTNDSTKQKKTLQDLIIWRRSKVLELLSKGHSQADITDILQVSHPTISRDVSWIREHSRENIHTFIQKRLPEELEKAFTSYDLIIKNSWHTADNTKDDKVKLQALGLVNQTIASKMEIINNEDLYDYVMDMGKDKGKKQEDNTSDQSVQSDIDVTDDNDEVIEEEDTNVHSE